MLSYGLKIFAVIVFIPALVFLPACTQAENPGQAEINAFQIEARAAAMQMGKNLKSELLAAINSGGPENAINICHKRAPEIAAEISQGAGLEIKRISLKNRNPNGRPNKWQEKILKDFERRKTAGENISKLEYTGYLDGEFRFVKAIPTKNLCLVCHGKNIETGLYKKIKTLYPDDLATGFEQGEIRGAFVVSKK